MPAGHIQCSRFRFSQSDHFFYGFAGTGWMHNRMLGRLLSKVMVKNL